MDAFVQRRATTISHHSDAAISGPAQSPSEPSAKRLKREISDSDEDSDEDLSDGKSTKCVPTIRREATVASAFEDAQSDHEPQTNRPTAIESSLPEVISDKEAVEEYETFRASQGDKPSDVASRFVKREWVKGKSSLYVDAFNLALGTVLDDESHLFDEKERTLFEFWESLSYEAQYL
jgi:Fanconi-associated nuclease 1